MAKRVTASVIKVDDFESAVMKAVQDYIGDVDKELKKGLDEAGEFLKLEEEHASPRGPGEDTHYADNWVMKKRGRTRYVTNTKTVKSKSRGEIPLINILEYSMKSPHLGNVKKVFRGAVPKMVSLITNRIKRL